MPDAWQLLTRYPIADPAGGEGDYLRANPNVSGMAVPGDGVIVLNPHSRLSGSERALVALNEAARLHQMDNGMIHSFALTPAQQSFFDGTPYATRPQMARHTVVARMLSGDPSAAPYTPEQRSAASGVLAGLMLGR